MTTKEPPFLIQFIAHPMISGSIAMLLALYLGGSFLQGLLDQRDENTWREAIECVQRRGLNSCKTGS